MTVATIKTNGVDFYIKCQQFDNERAKAVPERKWNNETRMWFAPASLVAAQYINTAYTIDEIEPCAREHISMILARETVDAIMPFPVDHSFKNQPRPYQSDALTKAYGMREFGLFMEMRTGKSFVDINLAAAYFAGGQIDAYLIVMFPGAIKTTWKLQLEEHMPVPYELLVVTAGQDKKAQQFVDMETDKLKIMVIGIESVSNTTATAAETMKRFVKNHKVKFTVDESTCIKNPKAITNKKTKKITRVKLCWDLAGLSEYRMIMTGTPVTQGVEDLYSQFRFLNWTILGYKSYFAYRNAHCIMGGFENKKITGYTNVNKVINAITPYIYQISTEDAIGIPDEVVETVIVEPSKEQDRILKELGDPYDMTATLGDEVLEVETILERMIRYQQVVGGHFPFIDGAGAASIVPLKQNPKMDALVGIIETLPRGDRAIIWARFVPEIKAIAAMLESRGESYVTYRGGMSEDEREHAQRVFMEDDGPRFWVASQQASARGIELASASVHIFYSNSFSYDDRKQASMRTSSSHQKAKSILYIDIQMNHKIDKQIIEALQYKQSISEYVIGEIKKGQ